MDTTNAALVLPICLVVMLVVALIVSIGLRLDLKTGKARLKYVASKCNRCGRDYHDHEAKHHYCPKVGGWAEVTFEEGSRE